MLNCVQQVEKRHPADDEHAPAMAQVACRIRASHRGAELTFVYEKEILLPSSLRAGKLLEFRTLKKQRSFFTLLYQLSYWPPMNGNHVGLEPMTHGLSGNLCVAV